MSIVCAAIKNNQVAIAADTQLSFGCLNVGASDLKNCTKLYRVNNSIVGTVGWKAMSTMLEVIIDQKSELFNLGNRIDIYTSLMRLHHVMKTHYFLETGGGDSQPVESMQLQALIINNSGIYEISRYREVNQYKRFWAIGSGQEYSLGAMEVLFDSGKNAQQLVEAGVIAAAKFDDGCSLPATSQMMPLNIEQHVAMVN